jgi:hypothetical protein
MLCLWQLLESQQDEERDRDRHNNTSPYATTHDRGHMCYNQTVCSLNLFNENNDDNYLLICVVWFKLVYVGIY